MALTWQDYNNRADYSGNNQSRAQRHDDGTDSWDGLTKRDEVRMRSYAEMRGPVANSTNPAAYDAALADYLEVLRRGGEASATDRAAAEARLNEVLQQEGLYDNYVQGGARIAAAFGATDLQGEYRTNAARDAVLEMTELRTILLNTSPTAHNFNTLIEDVASAMESGADLKTAVFDYDNNPSTPNTTLVAALQANPAPFGLSREQADALVGVINADARGIGEALRTAHNLPDIRGVAQSDLAYSVETSSLNFSVYVRKSGEIIGIDSAQEARDFITDLTNDSGADLRSTLAAMTPAARAEFRAQLISDMGQHGLTAEAEPLKGLLTTVDSETQRLNQITAVRADGWSYGVANNDNGRIDQFELNSIATNLRAMGYDIPAGNSRNDVQAALTAFGEDQIAAQPADASPRLTAADFDLRNMDQANEKDKFTDLGTRIAAARAANFRDPQLVDANPATQYQNDIRSLGTAEATALQEFLRDSGVAGVADALKQGRGGRDLANGGVDGDIGPSTIRALDVFCAAQTPAIEFDPANPQITPQLIAAIQLVRQNGSTGADVVQYSPELTNTIVQAAAKGDLTAGEIRALDAFEDRLNALGITGDAHQAAFAAFATSLSAAGNQLEQGVDAGAGATFVSALTTPALQGAARDAISAGR